MSSKSYEVQSIVASSPNTPPLIQKSEGGPKFQHFPELPVEIQNQIWQLALPEPRIVELHRKWRARSEYAYAIADPIVSRGISFRIPYRQIQHYIKSRA